MGMGLLCLLVPEVPSAEKFYTDGKNLGQAYICDSAGVSDFDQLFDDSATADVPTSPETAIFSALDRFIGEPGSLSGGPLQRLYLPAEGLAAIASTLQRLRGEEGATAIADVNLRMGCISDLETYAQMLQEAGQHQAQFLLVFEV